MNTKQLKQKILSLAIRGQLVPQDPSDEPASELLKRIKAERESTVEKGRKKKATTDTSHYQQQPPFELPKGWVWCKLGECTINRDNERIPISSEIRKKQQHKQYDYYGASGVIDKVDNYLFDERLLLIGEDGANLLSRSKNNAFFAEGKYWVNNHAHVIDAKPKNILSYIVLVINSIKLDDFITGSAQPKLSQDNLNKIPIPLPPLAEQQRITQEVNRLFTLIEQLEEDKAALQQLVSQLKSKILSLAIRGQLVPQDANDEPAETLLKRINPEYKSRGNLHYQPFEIPKSWVWVEHQIILGISGGAQPSKSYFSEEKSPNYVRLYQIRDYGDKPMPVYIPKELANKLTQKGDILLARYGGSLGKVFIAEEGAYNVAMAKIVFKFEGLIDKDFAYYYYLSEIYQDKLKSISRTAQAGFNSTDLSDMLFVLPPYNEQKRIAKRITELFNIIDEIQNALNS